MRWAGALSQPLGARGHCILRERDIGAPGCGSVRPPSPRPEIASPQWPIGPTRLQDIPRAVRWRSDGRARAARLERNSLSLRLSLSHEPCLLSRQKKTARSNFVSDPVAHQVATNDRSIDRSREARTYAGPGCLFASSRLTP